MNCIGKKRDQAIFVLFIPKCLKNKDAKKIVDWKTKTSMDKNKTAANAQLLPENRLKVKINSSNKVLNANKDFYKTESVADLKAGLEADFNIDHVNKTDLIFGLLAIEANET